MPEAVQANPWRLATLNINNEDKRKFIMTTVSFTISDKLRLRDALLTYGQVPDNVVEKPKRIKWPAAMEF